MTNTKSNQDNNVECAICYDKFNSSPISLICGHKFDEKCIVAWFNRGNYTCPCCRANIPQPIIINKTHKNISLDITPRITINYKKRMRISSYIMYITILPLICIALYSDIIQFIIHNKYVNSDGDLLLICLFLSDIYATIGHGVSAASVIEGIENLDIRINVNHYSHYIHIDKNAKDIHTGFYYYCVTMMTLIGLRIPAYCKSWEHLNADNMKSSTDALYINMILSSVLHTLLFMTMTLCFCISYKYVKIIAKIKRTVAPRPYP